MSDAMSDLTNSTRYGNLTYSTGVGTGIGNATLIEFPNLCTLQTCDLSMASFMYIPTLPGNAVYAAIFAICLVGQVYLGIKHKTWTYMTAVILGLVLEVVGYVGRILLWDNPFSNDAFLTYLITLTLAPAFLSASVYLCLARIVIIYGEEIFRFRPRTYTIFFVTCDTICLVLQAVGGGIASSATTQENSDLGRDIMMAGLVFQVVSLSVFTVAAVDVGLRAKKSKEDWNPRYLSIVNSRLFKAFLVGLAVAVITIFARSTYRVVELSDGFRSELFTDDEIGFMILEGVMIIIASTCLTVLHPAICFQGVWHEMTPAPRRNNHRSEKVRSFMTGDEESQHNIEMETLPAPK